MADRQGASAEVECLPAAPDAFLAAAAAGRLRAAVTATAGLGSNGGGASSAGKRAAVWREADFCEGGGAEEIDGGDGGAGPSYTRGGAAESSWEGVQSGEASGAARERDLKRQRLGIEAQAVKVGGPAHPV